MANLLIALEIVLALILIGLVLLQNPQGNGLGGLAGGGGGMNGVFSGRGQANFLTKATAVVAALFFGVALTLAKVSSVEQDARFKVPETVQSQAADEAPVAPSAGSEDAPAAAGAKE